METLYGPFEKNVDSGVDYYGSLRCLRAGVVWCYIPNGIAFGGITGVAQIIHHFIPAAPVGVSVIVLNVPLFLLGWKLLGGGTLISSLYAMTMGSLMIDWLAMAHTFSPTDPLLASIYGGVLVGLSMGLLLNVGAPASLLAHRDYYQHYGVEFKQIRDIWIGGGPGRRGKRDPGWSRFVSRAGRAWSIGSV